LAYILSHSNFLVGSIKRFFPARVCFGRSRPSKVIDLDDDPTRIPL